MKQRNFVAMHCRKYNKATVQKDKKKEAKRNGYVSTKRKPLYERGF